MKSIRKTLSYSIVSGLFLVTTLSGIAGFFWARHSLINQFDSVLASKARSIASLVEEEEGTIHVEFSDDNMPEFTAEKSNHFFQVWLPDGTVLARSKTLGKQDLPHPEGIPAKPGYETYKLHSGLKVRVVGFQFDPIHEVNEKRFPGPSNSKKVTIAVSRDTTELEAILTMLALFLASGAILLPLASAIVVSVAVKRGLRPLVDLAGTVGEIDATSLKTRVQAGKDIVELEPITTKLNALLSRLNVAFEREKRFTMDASHELRTPIAEARTALEIALKWPEDSALLQESAKQALASTFQMEAMVVALLALARAESDKTEAPQESISLEEIVQRCWSQLSKNAGNKSLSFSLAAADAGNVYTNRALVTAIITNLLTNAVQYAPPESVIDCFIGPGPEDLSIVLKISNAMATPIDTDDFERLFEPLWRKDKSRTEELTSPNAHFGLGLALVKAYCENLAIPCRAYPENDKFVIELQFPTTLG